MTTNTRGPFYTIYMITHAESGKIYIGKHKTDDLDDSYLGSGKILRRAISKYGKDSFSKEILFVFDNPEDMNCKEAELVTEEFCARSDTYNLCPGGKGGWGYVNKAGKNLYGSNASNFANAGIKGRKRIEELKKDPDWVKNTSLKISRALKGKQIWLGKAHTEDTKKKIGLANSKSQSGKKNSQYGTMWITDGKKNAKIKADDVIPDGWRKGRSVNNRS